MTWIECYIGGISGHRVDTECGIRPDLQGRKKKENISHVNNRVYTANSSTLSGYKQPQRAISFLSFFFFSLFPPRHFTSHVSTTSWTLLTLHQKERKREKRKIQLRFSANNLLDTVQVLRQYSTWCPFFFSAAGSHHPSNRGRLRDLITAPPGCRSGDGKIGRDTGPSLVPV